MLDNVFLIIYNEIRSKIPLTRGCLKNSDITKSEEFFWRTSKFFAGILNVFQEKFAQLCEKITAFWVC